MGVPLHIAKSEPYNTKSISYNVELERVSAAKYLRVTLADDFSWSHIDIATKRQI